MKKFLIIYAHPEPKSFCGSIKNVTVNKLKSLNHQLEVSDLYAQNFDPVVRPNNQLKSRKNPQFFNFISEQENTSSLANDFKNYPQDIQLELQRLSWADNLIFIFPIWWGSYPAILKGWMDKCLVYGHSWTAENLFEKGLFKDKKAIAVVTCDDSKENYSRTGLQGMTVDEMLHHFSRNSMGFVGVKPLKPYVFYQVSQKKDSERKSLLEEYEKAISDFDQLPECKF